MVGRRYVLATEKKRSETGDLSKCRMLTRDTIPPPEMVDVFERGADHEYGFRMRMASSARKHFTVSALMDRTWIVGHDAHISC